VRHVGIHLHADLGAVVDRLAQPRPIGVAEAVLLGTAQHADVPQFAAERFGLVGGAVGAAVVDDQDLHVRGSSKDLADQPLDVLDLVVGGDDNGGSHGRAA